MRRTIGAMLFWVLFLGLALGASAEDLRVFVLAGQSNMEGRGAKVGSLPKPLRGEIDGVFVFDGSGWVPMKPGRGLCGPEVGFALRMRALVDGPFGVIKHAKGGTSLDHDWSPSRKHSLYTELVEKVRLAGKARDIEVVGMLWMQGESDARESALAKRYKTNLSNLVIKARKAFGSRDMPFVAGRVNPPEGTYEHAGAVREATETCRIRSGYAWVDCDSLPKQKDKLHYTTAGYLELGRKMAGSLYLLSPDLRPGTPKAAPKKPVQPFLRANLDGLLAHRPMYCDVVPGLTPALLDIALAPNTKALSSAFAKAQSLASAGPQDSKSLAASRADVLAVLDSLARGQWDLTVLPLHRSVVSQEKSDEPELRGLPGVSYED